jgi:hypothetical protein
VLTRVVKNSVLCVIFLYIAGHPWSLEPAVLPGTYVCIAQVGLTPSVDANDLFVLKRR